MINSYQPRTSYTHRLREGALYLAVMATLFMQYGCAPSNNTRQSNPTDKAGSKQVSPFKDLLDTLSIVAELAVPALGPEEGIGQIVLDSTGKPTEPNEP